MAEELELFSIHVLSTSVLPRSSIEVLLIVYLPPTKTLLEVFE